MTKTDDKALVDKLHTDENLSKISGDLPELSEKGRQKIKRMMSDTRIQDALNGFKKDYGSEFYCAVFTKVGTESGDFEIIRFLGASGKLGQKVRAQVEFIEGAWNRISGEGLEPVVDDLEKVIN